MNMNYITRHEEDNSKSNRVTVINRVVDSLHLKNACKAQTIRQIAIIIKTERVGVKVERLMSTSRSHKMPLGF